MNKVIGNFKQKKAIILAFLVPLMFSCSPAQAVNVRKTLEKLHNSISQSSVQKN